MIGLFLLLIITNEWYEISKDQNFNIQHSKLGYIAGDGKLINGNLLKVSKLSNFKIYEPLNGCGNGKFKLSESKRGKNCIYSMNGGFFDKKTGNCIGNLVSNSKIIQNTNLKNINFGITENKFFTGYLNATEVLKYPFTQLISGLIWLVKDKKNFVLESSKIEDEKIQQTGSFSLFLNIRASRTSIGHDKDGNLLLLQMDGDGNADKGLTLYEFSDFMIEIGFINGINLDGGGSSVFFKNSEMLSYPSDGCVNQYFRCEREVSTWICIENDQIHYLEIHYFIDWKFFIGFLFVFIFILVIYNLKFSNQSSQ